MCIFPHVINPDAVWKQIISFAFRSRYNCSKQYDEIHSRCGTTRKGEKSLTSAESISSSF